MSASGSAQHLGRAHVQARVAERGERRDLTQDGARRRRPELGERLVDDVETDRRAAEDVRQRVQLVGGLRAAQHPGQLGDQRHLAHRGVDGGGRGLGRRQVDRGGVDERPRVAQRRAGQVGDVGQQRERDADRAQHLGSGALATNGSGTGSASTSVPAVSSAVRAEYSDRPAALSWCSRSA